MDARPASHPADTELQSFALGKLDDRAAGGVRDHLGGGVHCRTPPAELTDGSSFPEPYAPDATPAPPSAAWREALASKKPLPDGVPPELAAHDGYEIVRELGRGGMGVVYLARNQLMHRPEVLKVLNKSLVGQPGAVERFLQEIRSAARLNHPNVATAYNALQLGDLLVLAMEYVEGEDLGKVVKARGALPVANACYYAQQAALGLQRGHELGLVH